MKALALLLFIFLSACSTTIEHSEKLVYSNNIPNAWMIEGRISIMRNKKTTIAGFELSQQDGYYQLILSKSFGFGEIQIKQTEKGLFIDGKHTLLTLEEWINLEFGWYFPVDILENIVFKQNNNTIEGWKIRINKHQVFNGIVYPQIINLNHFDKHIKIKLLLQEVNRLK